jgi:hypothetical protein
LLPVAALLASATLTETHRREATPRIAAIAGFLAGLACYGYFIYGFLVPAAAGLAVCRWRRLPATRRLIGAWIGGWAVGVLPYLLAFLLVLVATGGPRGFSHYISADLNALGAQSSTLSLAQRLHYFVDLVRGAIIETGPTAMMLHDPVVPALPALKLILLLAVPGVALVSGLARPTYAPGLLVLGGIVLGFFALVLAFGNRLWLHHAALLLPVLYAALALALERLASVLAPRRARIAGAVLVIVLMPFLVANAADLRIVFLRLQATGGVGLASDAIDRFAQDGIRETKPVHMFFPDWGVFMSFVMITRGEIPYSNDFSPAAALAVLCDGQDAELVTVASQPRKRLDDWIAAVEWKAPDTQQYNQRDGSPVLVVTRWRAADRPPQACRQDVAGAAARR